MSSQVATINNFPLAAPKARAKTQTLGVSTIALAVLITSFFYCLPLGRGAVAGIASDYRIYDFVFIGFVFVAALPRLSRVGELIKNRNRFQFWGIILLILLWLSLLLTFSTGGGERALPALVRAFRFTAYLLTATFIVAIVDNPRRYKFLLIVFFANISVQAIIGFAQGLGLIPALWPDYWLLAYNPEVGTSVPVATLSPHHKHIAVVMMLGIAMAATFLRMYRRTIIRVLLIVLMALMLMTIAFSGARTGLVGVATFAVAYLYMHRGRALMLLVVVVLGIMGFYQLTREYVQKPLEDIANERIVSRMEKMGYEGLYEERTSIYFTTLPHGLQRYPWLPLTGTGFQNMRSYFAATGAHNNYLHVWIELGIIGFLVYLMFLWKILKTLRETARRAVAPFEKCVAKDVWAVFIAVLATMLVGETLWAQYNMFTLTGQIMTLVALAVCPLNWAPAPKLQLLRNKYGQVIRLRN